MFLNGELNDANTVRKLNKALEYIASDAHVNEYDHNLNGESCETLAERFSAMAKSDLDTAKAASDARQLTPNEDYVIVPIDSYKEASKYGKYTSWCVTHYPNMYDSYTNQGIGRFYFCLRKDFKTVQATEGEGCPLDDYGLSMIAVSVTCDGEANTITCRWNHDNGGNDNIMTVEQLEDVIGRNFYQTFVPYSREELTAKGIVFKDEVQGLLDNGTSLTKIFTSISPTNVQNIRVVWLRDEYNYLKDDKTLLSPKLWFDGYPGKTFKYGFTEVCYHNKMNAINVNGELLLREWVQYFYGFVCPNVAPVENEEHLHNAVDNKGNYIFKQWYNYLSPLYENNEENVKYFAVKIYPPNAKYMEQINSPMRVININGEPVSDVIFKTYKSFTEGALLVENDKGLHNYIDLRNGGKLLSEVWFNDAQNFRDGMANVLLRLTNETKFEVYADNSYTKLYANYLRRDGRFLMDKWVNYCWPFYHGIGLIGVTNDGNGGDILRNYITTDGKLLSKAWFDWADTFGIHDPDYGRARIGDREIVVKRDGTMEGLFDDGSDYGPTVAPIEVTDDRQIIRMDRPQETLAEARIGNFDFKKYFKPIAEFMHEDGLNVKPYPKVKLDWSEQDGLFIKTGYYEPESKTITIFCNDRHPKDILRTFCHEMIHHSQNLDGVDLNFSSEDAVKDNDKLEEIESEAYLKGNVYFRKWTEYANKGKEMLQENKEYEDVIYESTDPEDIDLSSFNIKTALNPKFWKDEHLDSRIRMRLLDIADDFIEFLGVDWVKPDDVIMTGSLANYNWNKKFSDVDLHVLMDFSKVDKRTDFVKEYFDSKKNLWNESHKDLSICGFPVEVYVQDSKEKHASTGVYSLDKDKWITEPNRKSLKSSKINKEFIKKKVSEFMDKIDKIDDIYKSADNDSYKARKASEEAEKLWAEIKAQRKQGLSNAKNEITNGNIIYKTLRRLGYLDKIFSLRDKSYDKVNSLDESYD